MSVNWYVLVSFLKEKKKWMRMWIWKISCFHIISLYVIQDNIVTCPVRYNNNLETFAVLIINHNTIKPCKCQVIGKSYVPCNWKLAFKWGEESIYRSLPLNSSCELTLGQDFEEKNQSNYIISSSWAAAYGENRYQWEFRENRMTTLQLQP